MPGVRPCAEALKTGISCQPSEAAFVITLGFINCSGLSPSRAQRRGEIVGPSSELGEMARRFAGPGGMMPVVVEGRWTSGRPADGQLN